MKQKYPIVIAHCRDQAFYGGSCYDTERAKFEVSKLTIVGHLIRNDPEKVAVATELCDDYEVRYVHVIPWVNISKLERLNTVEEIERAKL